MSATLERCTDGCDCNGWMGGDASKPSWSEYISRYSEPWQWRLAQAKEWLEGQDGVPRANEICNDYHLRFSDGIAWMPSWRGWGDFVQAAVNKREGYMSYYFRTDGKAWCPDVDGSQ